MPTFKLEDVADEHRVRLRGTYARGVWSCPHCRHDHWPEDQLPPEHWIGVAELRGSPVIVRECVECFQPFYHHDRQGSYYDHYVKGEYYERQRRLGLG